jgi:hypothetical protein
MTFFNKKTDVIDIELTPYGRYLLSIGKLKPKFYDFSDDDVLYDVSADGASKESPNDAHNRIVTDTPKLKTLYLTKGVESDSLEDYGSAVAMNIDINTRRKTSQEVSYNQVAVQPMGRSSYETEILPSFQATALAGEFSGSVGYLSSSIVQLPIPQIDLDFTISATTETLTRENENTFEHISKVINGQFIRLSYTNPIIHLKEFGSFYEKENFDIEVFEVKNYKYKYQGPVVGANQMHERLNRKRFIKKQENIVNGMLVEQDVFYNENQYSPENVEYFFRIQVDNEIPTEEVCRAVDKLEINSQFLDDEIICPDQRNQQFDIYTSRVDPSDLEDCD